MNMVDDADDVNGFASPKVPRTDESKASPSRNSARYRPYP